MSEYKYTGYSDWDLIGTRRERIGADCIRAFESSGEEQYAKAAARIIELEAENAALLEDMEKLESEHQSLIDFCKTEVRRLPPEYIKQKARPAPPEESSDEQMPNMP